MYIQSENYVGYMYMYMYMYVAHNCLYMYYYVHDTLFF